MQIMASPTATLSRPKVEVTEVKTDEDNARESERAQLFGSGFGATINLISTAIGGGGKLYS